MSDHAARGARARGADAANHPRSVHANGVGRGVDHPLVRDVAAALDAVPLADLDRSGLVDAAAAVGRCRAMVDGLEARVAAAVAALDDDGMDAAAVLRHAGRYSQRDANRRARRSEALDELPTAAEKLRRGSLSGDHVDALARAAAATSPDAVERSGLADAVTGKPADLAAKQIRDWTGRHQRADRTRSAHLRRRAARRCVAFTGDDDMTIVYVALDPVTGAQVISLLDAECRQLFEADGGRGRASEARTSEQRRADAFASLLGIGTDAPRSGSEAAGSSPSARRVTGRNQIVIVAETGVLTGERPDGRCEIPGVGPVPVTELERLGCDADLFGILFSGDGDPLWHGRRHRTATDAQWRALVARDRGCVQCDAPPGRCEAHHLDAWTADHGCSDIDRLALLCRWHHHQLHDHDRVLRRRADGTWQTRPRPDRVDSAPGRPPPTPRRNDGARTAGGCRAGSAAAGPPSDRDPP